MTDALVVYYSRTGWTKKVAKEIAHRLAAETEEIADTAQRGGITGWLRSGREAVRKATTTLEPPKRDPDVYDLVVIGTPVWAKTVSTPVRTYLQQHADRLAKVAFFCTCGGGEPAHTFTDMQELCGQPPKKTLCLKTRNVRRDDYEAPVESFVSTLLEESDLDME